MAFFHFKQIRIFPFITTKWVAHIVLILGLSLTILSAYFTHITVKDQLFKEFKQVCTEIQMKIETRLNAHEQILLNGRAHFTASDTVTRQNWKTFIERSKIHNNLPGIQGIGFSILILKSDFEKHVNIIKSEGFPDYNIRPISERDTFSSIIFLEPFEGRNLRAFGYDMYSEPVRKNAMMQARDTDKAALSGKVELVQETETNIQPGTLMYVPVYKNNYPINNAEERRAALIGWIYSPYRMSDLMEGILGRWDSINSKRIHLQVYDNETFDKNSLLFDSQQSNAQQNTDNDDIKFIHEIDFNGKKWFLHFSQSDNQDNWASSKAGFVAVSGILISLLLYFLTNNLVHTSRRALKIAENLNNELRQNEELFALFINSTSDIVFTLDTQQRHSGLYGDWAEKSGLSKNYFLGKTAEDIFGKDRAQIHVDANTKALTGQNITYEWEITQNEHTIYYQTSLSPIFKLGKIIGIIGVGRNITALKESGFELEKSEKIFRESFQFLPIPLALANKNGNIISFNNHFIKTYGYTTTDAPTIETWALKAYPDEEYRKQVMQQWERDLHESINQGIPTPSRDYNVTDKFGKTHNVQILTMSLGEMHYTSFIDLTEYKNLLNEIKTSEENYSRFFNALEDFIWILDQEGNIIYANNYVFEKLNYTPEELYGMNVLMVHPPERRTEAAEIIGKMLNGLADFCPIPVISKYGKIYPAETRITHGVWNGKNVIYGISKDISELTLSEEKFSKAFHNNSNAMFISDFETDVIIEVNKVFLQFFNYSQTEILGKTTQEINLFDAEIRIKIKAELSLNNCLNNFEFSPVIAGTQHHTIISAELIFLQDKKCMLIVIQDVTLSKEYEMQLKKNADELNQLNKDKDMFMSILAHDLKSPFNLLLGFSDLLLRNVYHYDTKKIEHQLKIINNTAQTTYNLLNDLLLWSKSQSGMLPYNPKILDLSLLIAEILKVTELSANAKNIHITLNINSYTTVLADENMLATILRNLISNALKFTYENGSINISAVTNGNFTEVSVADTGMGISLENQRKLWNMSTPFSTPGTNDEKGTGLGLLLCKDFVEKHGGKIWVESVKGEGSQFYFTIPSIQGDKYHI